jgi:hypothetical protein
MGVNEKEMPEKTPVSFALLDNHHLSEHGVLYFAARIGTDIGGFVVSPFFRLNLYSGFLSFPLFLERTYMADSVAFYRTDIFSFVASGQSP